MPEIPKYAFRETFKATQEIAKWYPGHMHKGMAQMQTKMKSLDCVIEVHDARIPVSGRNPNFIKKLLGIKPHILVLNKVDLIPHGDIKLIKEKMRERGIDNVIFTNCLRAQKCEGIKQLVPKALELISNSQRFNRTESQELNLMVIGIPNVGKSSIINALRCKNLQRGKATAVGAVAGITRSVLNKIKIHYSPPMFLVDTPGILPPNIENEEVGLKLALCSCMKDTSDSDFIVADFLLYWLNRTGNFSYVNELQLDNPQDDIRPVLKRIAENNEKFKKFKDLTNNSIRIVPDTAYSAKLMIKKFRTGAFGLINLDKELLA